MLCVIVKVCIYVKTHNRSARKLKMYDLQLLCEKKNNNVKIIRLYLNQIKKSGTIRTKILSSKPKW